MIKRLKTRLFEFIQSYQWWIFGILIVLDLALGFWGFTQKLSKGAETGSIVSDALYQTFLMFAFESVAQDNVPAALEIARWVAIFIAGFAVIKAVMLIGANEFVFFRLRFYKGHVIVCGLNNKGSRLINSFLNSMVRKKVIVIDPDPKHDLISIYRDHGVTVINGNPSDPALLKRVRVSKAGYLFALTDNDEYNVEIAYKAYQIVRPFKKGDYQADNAATQNRHQLNCYIHIHDLTLQALIKRHALFRDPFDRLNGRVVNIYETSARSLFNLYPPDLLGGPACSQWDAPAAHIMVIGFGDLGKSVALQAIRLCHYASLKNTKVTVFDVDASKKEMKLAANYPGVGSLIDLRFMEKDPECLDAEEIIRINKEHPVSAIYVCIEDDSVNFLTASRIARRLDNANDNNRPGLKVVACMPENTVLSSVLELDISLDQSGGKGIERAVSNEEALIKPDNLFVFNTISESCTWALLVDEQLDRVAIALHGDYQDTITPEKRQKKLSARNWDHLPEEYRDSNRLKADFLMVRQRAIFSYYHINDYDNIPADFEKNDVLIERLARMEHRRWMAEKILSGWSYSDIRDEKHKKNENLLDWDRLIELEKHDVIDLNLSDSRNLRKMLRYLNNKA